MLQKQQKREGFAHIVHPAAWKHMKSYKNGPADQFPVNRLLIISVIINKRNKVEGRVQFSLVWTLYWKICRTCDKTRTDHCFLRRNFHAGFLPRSISFGNKTHAQNPIHLCIFWGSDVNLNKPIKLRGNIRKTDLFNTFRIRMRHRNKRYVILSPV